MKIIEICPYDMSRPGGVQTHIRDLSNWLRAQGHEVRVLAPKTATTIDEPGLTSLGHARKIGFQGSQFEVSYIARKELARTVADIRGFGGELVHLHTPWTPFMAWQLWRALKLPSVATFHATIPEHDSQNLSTRMLFSTAKYFMSRVQATIVPSTAPLPALSRLADAHNIAVLPPSINLEAWHRAGLQGEKSMGEAKSILYLGRLEPRKGLDTLLKAWPLIAKALPNTTLTIAGGGELENDVLAAQHQGNGRVVFVRQPDQKTMLSLAARADLLLATAQYGESFGLILLEAMAAGIVPIAAANSGYTTVMTGKGAELLVEPGNADELANTAISLAKDPHKREDLRRWGAQHVKKFDLKKIGPEFEKLFQSAVDQRR